jgi:DNA repair protein RadC
MSKYNLLPTKAITTSKDCAEVFRKVWKKKTLCRHERVYVLYLNSISEPIMYKCINIGTYTETLFDIGSAIEYAYKCNSPQIAIAHNHTTEILHPSQKDIELTESIVHILQMTHRQLMDHIILTEKGYYSFRDAGLLDVQSKRLAS